MSCNGCGHPLKDFGYRPCAILICTRCRNDIDTFRRVRSLMFAHIDDHLAEGRKLNKDYPFHESEAP